MSLHTTHVPPHYTCPSTQSLLRTVPHPHEKALSCTDVCWEYTHPNLSTLCSPISAPHHPSYVLRTRDAQPRRDLDNDKVLTYTCQPEEVEEYGSCRLLAMCEAIETSWSAQSVNACISRRYVVHILNRQEACTPRSGQVYSLAVYRFRN